MERLGTSHEEADFERTADCPLIASSTTPGALTVANYPSATFKE